MNSVHNNEKYGYTDTRLSYMYLNFVQTCLAHHFHMLSNAVWPMFNSFLCYLEAYIPLISPKIRCIVGVPDNPTFPHLL